MRIKILRVVIIGLFILIAVDLMYVQAIRGRYFYRLSTNNRIRVVPLEGWGGRIMDRQGKVLADNRIAYNVTVTPQAVKEADKLFGFLSEVLEVEPHVLLQRYRQKKVAPFAPVVVAQDVNRKTAIVLEENKYRFPSLLVQESFRRVYPYDQNGAHVLGYVGKINRSKVERFKEYGYSAQSVIGYSGVEEYYDDYLKGEEGGLQIEVDSRGQQVRLLSLKEPRKGQDITLTIDTAIQGLTRKLLEDKVGSIVVMDMDNGEILALENSPTYDPNIFVNTDNPVKRRRVSRVLSSRFSPMVNRAIKGLFPPGSVFKVPVAICALDSKKITQYSPFLCPGQYELAGIIFGCTHAHGSQNLVESLVHSCNVYYYNIGRIVGADLINRYARLLGLGRLTHVDLPYEEPGLIPSRQQKLLSGQRWYTGDTLNFSIGQGDVLVTPLQLVRMMAIVGKKGIEVQPHVIQAIGGRAVEKYSLQREVKVDKEVLKTIQKALRATVTEFSGTAHALELKGLHVAGKTGTAQTSGEKEHHAWFVGYVKGTKKNIAFCVFLEHGGSSHNATLVARQLLVRMQEERIL